eukprot:scaffold86660_cov18-Tisochrysis_lutea.AAC.2
MSQEWTCICVYMKATHLESCRSGSTLYRASEWTLSYLDKVSSLRGSNLFNPAKYYSTWEQ